MLRRRATLVMKKAITCYKPAFWAWIASMKDGKPQVWGCQSGNICTLLLLSMPWGKRTDYTCFVTLCRLTAVNHVVTWAGFPYWLCAPIEPDAALASWICMQVFVLGSHQLSLGNRHGNSDYFQSEQSICVCMYKPISYKLCCGTEVPMIFSESKLVVFSISMPEEGVAAFCKLNGFANNYNVLCLSGEDA